MTPTGIPSAYLPHIPACYGTDKLKAAGNVAILFKKTQTAELDHDDKYSEAYVSKTEVVKRVRRRTLLYKMPCRL